MAVEKLSYSRKFVRQSIRKIFHGDFIVQKVMNRHTDGQSVNIKKGIVNVYSYTEDNALKILRFEKMTEEWLDFVGKCRGGYIHDYDIVEGPMADDTIWNFVNDF